MRETDVRKLRSQLKLLERRLRDESPPLGGLSRSAMRVLIVTSRSASEGAQPKRLADELQMTSSNVAAAFRELEAGGLVRRVKQAADSRRVHVFVTEAGEALVAGFRSERNTWLGRAVEAVLNEREQQVLIEAGGLMERLATYTPQSAREGGVR